MWVMKPLKADPSSTCQHACSQPQPAGGLSQHPAAQHLSQTGVDGMGLGLGDPLLAVGLGGLQAEGGGAPHAVHAVARMGHAVGAMWRCKPHLPGGAQVQVVHVLGQLLVVLHAHGVLLVLLLGPGVAVFGGGAAGAGLGPAVAWPVAVRVVSGGLGPRILALLERLCQVWRGAVRGALVGTEIQEGQAGGAWLVRLGKGSMGPGQVDDPIAAGRGLGQGGKRGQGSSPAGGRWGCLGGVALGC